MYGLIASIGYALLFVLGNREKLNSREPTHIYGYSFMRTDRRAYRKYVERAKLKATRTRGNIRFFNVIPRVSKGFSVAVGKKKLRAAKG